VIRRVIARGSVSTLLAAAASLPAASLPAASASAPRTPIRHLVVMTQDQHSFDNYFGARPGVDGIPAGVCMPFHVHSATPCVRPFPLATKPPHQLLRPTRHAQLSAIAAGRMNGFVQAQASRTVDGSAAMGYYRPQDIPRLSALADHGMLFDHWFSSVPGGTVENRYFAITARSANGDDVAPARGWPDSPVIFDRLQAAGVSWRVYVENYEPALTIETASTSARQGGQVGRVPLLAMRRYLADASLMRHVVDLSSYYVDVARGRLPEVSFIVTTASTEHPPDAPVRGQRVALTVANGLIASPAWSSSALLLYYDSAGGWYDHVRPPLVDGAQLGLRVPAVLISPYVQPGTVNHGTFDSAAILAFIERNWRLPSLTRRDRDAPDLAGVFTSDRAAQRPRLIQVGAVDTRPAQPNSVTLYAGYALTLAAGVGLVAWAGIAGRRRKGQFRRIFREPGRSP
jgi:phospholipase C